MIAKLIAWGPDRDAAIARLSRALDATEIAGPATNLPLLRAIAANPAFRAAALDTGFIARHAETLLAPRGPVPREALAAAVARILLDQARPQATDPADPYSPWNAASAWRLNGEGYQDILLAEAGTVHTLRAHPREGGFRLDLPGVRMEVTASEAADGTIALGFDGTALPARVLHRGDDLTIWLRGNAHALRVVDPRVPLDADVAAAGRILAPMPGKVLEVLVSPGQAVTRGAVLLVLEAMKVQMRISAPADGTVSAILCSAGDLVEDGAELVTFD